MLRYHISFNIHRTASETLVHVEFVQININGTKTLVEQIGTDIFQRW